MCLIKIFFRLMSMPQPTVRCISNGALDLAAHKSKHSYILNALKNQMPKLKDSGGSALIIFFYYIFPTEVSLSWRHPWKVSLFQGTCLLDQPASGLLIFLLEVCKPLLHPFIINKMCNLIYSFISLVLRTS